MIESQGWCVVAPPKQELLDFRERLAGSLRNEPTHAMVPTRKEAHAWIITEASSASAFNLMHQQWLADRSRLALFAIQDCVEISAKKLGGVPVFRGTRFSIS